MTRAIRGLVLIGLCACSFADNHSTVTVTDAWIPEGPPTSPFIAVYLSIKNLGNHPQRLLTARHASGRAAVIHQTSEVNGVARMSSVDGLTVEPGASIEFAPGGYHCRDPRAIKQLRRNAKWRRAQPTKLAHHRVSARWVHAARAA